MSKQMEVTKKKIGDYTFYIKPFPAFVAANISGELSQVIGPVIGSAAPLFTKVADNSVDDIMNMEMDDALPIFTNALSTLSGDKFERLMRRLLVENKNISVRGELTEDDTELLDMDLANEIFCGELQDMFLLCFEVIKINFSGFFRKIAGQFGNLQGFTEKIIEQKNTASST